MLLYGGAGSALIEAWTQDADGLGVHAEERENWSCPLEQLEFLAAVGIPESWTGDERFPGIGNDLQRGFTLDLGSEPSLGPSDKVGGKLDAHEGIEVVKFRRGLPGHTVLVDIVQVEASGETASPQLLRRGKALEGQILLVESEEGNRKPIQCPRQFVATGRRNRVDREAQVVESQVGAMPREIPQAFVEEEAAVSVFVVLHGVQ